MCISFNKNAKYLSHISGLHLQSTMGKSNIWKNILPLYIVHDQYLIKSNWINHLLDNYSYSSRLIWWIICNTPLFSLRLSANVTLYIQQTAYFALVGICEFACDQYSGPWFNIKMSSYQYRKSHCGDQTILWTSYLHNGISYTGKMTSLYRIRALVL